MQTFKVLLAICLVHATNTFGPKSEIDLMSSKISMEADLAPFYHGVASGDPLCDAVIIWTRVTLTNAKNNTGEKFPFNENITVSWEMSTDATFQNVVESGSAETGPHKDYTIKVDVQNLESYRYYYYRFLYENSISMIGRTKTAPSSEHAIEQLRLATVSCSNLQEGFFNAYDRIVDRNDVDAVIHLGDYIYEYGGENTDPAHETVSLTDYRTRYSQYRLNPSLRSLHQQFPFIAVWDDHEIANDGSKEGAKEHQEETEGLWSDRIQVGSQAYDEWIPIRLPEPSNPRKIYRKISYGTLADIFLLDTRYIGRDKQAKPAFTLYVFTVAYNGITDPDQEMLGPEQREWMQKGLSESKAQWKIVAQQTMMSPLRVLNFAINLDQWDGYVAERDNFLAFLNSNNIDNVIVLTGDIHFAFASDVPFRSYNPSTGKDSVAVEFVTTTVSSYQIPVPLIGFLIDFLVRLLERNNPHIKYINLDRKGYGLLDITNERAQNDYYFTGPVDTLNSIEDYGGSYFTASGNNRLEKGVNGASTSSSTPQRLAPDSNFSRRKLSDNSKEVDAAIILGIYPFMNQDLEIIVFLPKAVECLCLNIMDVTGTVIELDENMGSFQSGVQQYRIPIASPTWQRGQILLTLLECCDSDGDQILTKSYFRFF